MRKGWMLTVDLLFSSRLDAGSQEQSPSSLELPHGVPSGVHHRLVSAIEGHLRDTVTNVSTNRSSKYARIQCCRPISISMKDVSARHHGLRGDVQSAALR